MLRQRFLQVGVLVSVTSALALSAQAATFSEANLKGRYSYMLNKWTVDVGMNQVANVGVMTFDGAGNMTGSATKVGGGVSEGGALSGTYTVNSDGTGMIEVTSTLFNPPTIQYGFVLNSLAGGVAHGFQFMQTDNGNNVVISGTALLQSPIAVHYSLASLKGSFALQFNAWSTDPDFDEQGGIGTITFDGEGNLKESLTSVDRGEVHGVTLTGTYAVNADGSCSGSFVQPDGSMSNFACALNSVGPLGANGFQAVVTNPQPTGADDTTNYAVTATGVKQVTQSIPIL
jgi:hypothetical protein